MRVIALSLVLAGCGGISTSTPDASDSSAAADESTTDEAAPVDAAQRCTDLEAVAPFIETMESASIPPVPLGGRIREGRYRMVAATVFDGVTGAPSAPVEKVIRFGAQHFESVTRTPLDELRESGGFVVGNATLRLGPLCPTDRGESLTFTATVSELRLYRAENGSVREEVFIPAP